MEYNDTLSGLLSGYLLKFIEQATHGVDREDLPYIVTHTGKRFRHLDPRPEDVCIDDIAHALSRICRYTGHVTPPHYSVAQHSVLVSRYCEPKDAMWGLLHDSSEAYCSDLNSPFKRLPGMEGYRLYEKRVMKAICEHFSLDPIEPDSVKWADRCVLTTEMRDLFAHPNIKREVEERSQTWPPYDGLIDAWSQEEAEARFLLRYRALRQTWQPRTMAESNRVLI